MVNRMNTNVTRETDKLNDNDTLAVLSYFSELVSSRPAHSTDNSISDELIRSLSDSYENMRARQVTEWERLRRQTVQRSM
jgi:hypothetical protein